MTPDRVLFDPPGPRARRRIRIITVLSLLAFVLVLAGALRQFSQHGQLASDRWQPFSQASYIRFLWDGLVGTLRVTAVSAVIASSSATFQANTTSLLKSTFERSGSSP